MAIFGAGSVWDGDEVRDDFFHDDCFTIGWNRQTGSDLQSSLASLKIGDIIYLKSNQPGSRKIRIKGIGIVVRSFIECVQNGEYPSGQIINWESFFIRVKWVVQDEFILDIPADAGRMTNIRAATFYEEPLPYVQQQIVARILQACGQNLLPLHADEVEQEKPSPRFHVGTRGDSEYIVGFTPVHEIMRVDKDHPNADITGLKYSKHKAGDKRPGGDAIADDQHRLTMLVQGGPWKQEMWLAGEERQSVLLNTEGDYIAWEPGYSHVWEALGEATMLTISFRRRG